MTDGGQDFDLGQVVGSAGAKGDDGSTVWNTSTAPTYANSKYTFTISNLSGKTGLQIAVNDIIFYSTYYYIVSAVNTTTVDCSTRVSIKGSDATVTIATSFGSTPSDSKVPSEKLTKNSLDAKQETLVSGTNLKTINNNSLLGSGNITIEGGSNVDVVTSWEATLSDTKVPSEKLTKNSLDAKADASSLATVATTGDYDDLTDKPTIPSASTTTPSADTSSGSYGSGTSYARSNHTHPKSSLYAEATHSHTKSQITDFPSIPSKTSDLINDGADGTNVFVANNDSRLSDARTPTAHAHGQITSDGSNTSTAVTIASDDKILITDTSDSSKIKRVNGLLASHISDSTAHSNIGSSANATQASINTSIDTALSGKQATLVSGTSIKTINNETLLGSGNITIQGGGGSGGSYINDFYGDSSTNELIIDYDTGVSQADIVTSWNSTPSDDDVPSEKLTKDTLDGKASSSHTHGNISSDGKVGSNSGYFVTTTTSGAVTSQQKIGNIDTSGKIGTTSGKPIITTTGGTLSAGSFGTSSGTFAEGNHTHNYSSINNVSTVDVVVTYTDSTTETIKLLKYTGS